MGGQACVFYGAAEFSRDTDLVILASADNLERLGSALRELKAVCIAVPAFAIEHLNRGHAVHFRCQDDEAHGMRVDVMSVLRGLGSFSELWTRRTTLTDAEGSSSGTGNPSRPSWRSFEEMRVVAAKASSGSGC